MLEEQSCRVGERTVRLQAAPVSSGYPVLVHPGTPGSRHLFLPQVEMAGQRGLRLISWDRPGYGDTPGRPGRRVGDAAAEATAVADHLGLDRFATWGFSGGGPFALACAALLPTRVSAAVVMASLAPYDAAGLDWAGRFSERGRSEIKLFFEDSDAYRRLHAESAAESLAARSTANGWLSAWGSAAGTDEAHGRVRATHLAWNFREALSHGDEGWYEDDVAFLSPWGFEPGEIRAPVALWQGTADFTVDHGRWLSERIPAVRARFADGEDHSVTEMRHQADAWDWILRTVTGL